MESASEFRLYRGSGEGILEVVRLNAVGPPRAVDGDLHAPEVDGAGADIFVALVQGGTVVDFARLVFRGGEPTDADGGEDCYSTNKSTSDEDSAAASSVPSRYEVHESPENSFGFGSAGLMVDLEDGQWMNPKWEGEGDDLNAEGIVLPHSASSDTDDSSTKLGQTKLWRSAYHSNSSSDDEDADQDEDKGQHKKHRYQSIKTDDDPKSGDKCNMTDGFSSSSRSATKEDLISEAHDENGFSSTKLGQSKFWRSAYHSNSSSDDEDADQELDQHEDSGQEKKLRYQSIKTDDDPKSGDKCNMSDGLSSSTRSATKEDLISEAHDENGDSSTKLGQSKFWRSAYHSNSSSDDEDADQELDQHEDSGQEKKLRYQSIKTDDDPKSGDKCNMSDGLSSSTRSATKEDLISEAHDENGDSSTKLGQSKFWRSAYHSNSSSDDEDADQELDQHEDSGQEKKLRYQSIKTDDDPKSGDKCNMSDGLSSSTRSATKEDLISEAHDENGDLSIVEQDPYTGKEGQDDDRSVQINARLFPAQKHAIIKIFSGGEWVFTKDYALVWLDLQDMPESTLKVEFGAPFATILGFRNTDYIMDFKINQLKDSSEMLSDVMTLLKPSICDFQIIKKVGGQGACKVFKCLFMGRRCALKSLTQENTCALEPREIEVISNLKDTHVMTFYQAWIEPWAYKGKTEQNYLFIHLEFCPSTLKHALLYKNRHWFPNKWLLFEEILQIVHKLHEAYIVHRDLKPDNIFLDSKLAVRVGDFGDACMGCDELGFYGGGTPNLGTQYYFAPELNSVGKVTEKVDIYSLGVILLEIFAMFGTVVERSTVFRNLSEKGPPESWDGDSELYGMMTALEPDDRPSAAEVLDYIHRHHSE